MTILEDEKKCLRLVFLVLEYKIYLLLW